MNALQRLNFQGAIFQTLLILIVSYFLAPFAMAETSSSSNNPNPKVVVSIPPFYALVSEIMKGTGSNPLLLIKTGASVHHAVLSPKDVRMLDEADIIFWGGPNLETFLINPLKIVENKKKTIVELDKTPGIHWLPTRYSVDFKNSQQNSDHADEHNENENTIVAHTAEEHEHDHDHGNDHGHHHGPIDMHFWLDPDNALILVDAITQQLSLKNPDSRAQYEQNAKNLKIEIKNADTQLKQSLKPIQSKPYLVYHDGYQYFENHYHLNAVGAITADPELPVSIERLKNLRDIINQEHVECVFTEPNTNPKLVQSLAKDFHLRMGVLDPLESPEPSKNLSYPALLEGLSNSLKSCLEQP